MYHGPWGLEWPNSACFSDPISCTRPLPIILFHLHCTLIYVVFRPANSFPPWSLCTCCSSILSGTLFYMCLAKSFPSLGFQLKCHLPMETFSHNNLSVSQHSLPLLPNHFIPLSCFNVYIAVITILNFQIYLCHCLHIIHLSYYRMCRQDPWQFCSSQQLQCLAFYYTTWHRTITQYMTVKFRVI